MIDIRTLKSKPLQSDLWTRRFGTHEDAGWKVNLGRTSASITDPKINLTWCIDKEVVPAAFKSGSINLVRLEAELYEAICSKMSPKTLDLMFKEIQAGTEDTQDRICQVLGIIRR